MVTENQYYQILQAYEELADDTSGLGGKHALLIAALNKAGYYPNSWQEAIKTAERILWN
jgi:hypothetical protein